MGMEESQKPESGGPGEQEAPGRVKGATAPVVVTGQVPLKLKAFFF